MNIYDFSLHTALHNTSIKRVRIIVGEKAVAKRIRSPIVDGLFYPENPEEVLSFMQSIGLERGKGGFAKAIIAPHGAWEISGSLAGAAFASAGGRAVKRSQFRKSPFRIVILGPIHDSGEEGIFLTNSHSFQTPLGDILVDKEATEWVETYSPLIKVNDIPHLREHSIEVLLPFVKYCFPQAVIVPVLMSGQKKQYIRVLANALRAVFLPEMDNTLIIISFNMTAKPEENTGMADECMRLFREGRYDKLYRALQNGEITGCGSALITALLQSGLVEETLPCPAKDLLLSANGEKNKTVYYGGFAFV
jgi:hypothetical protein